MDKRVVITGIGPLTSIGIGKDSFWKNILSGKVAINKEEVCLNGDIWDSFYVHRIKDFDINEFGIDQKHLNDLRSWNGKISIDLLYLIAAVKLALDDSKIRYNHNKNDISLVVTHENPGLGEFYSLILDNSFEIFNKAKKRLTKKQYVEEMFGKFSKTAYDLQTFMVLFHLVKLFGLHGYSYFINNACASGLYAIEAASQIIKSDLSSIVIIAAGDHPDIYKYLWFKKIGLYSNDGKIRPFAKNSNGFVFGDGSTGIVLEELEHAIHRKAHIYGEYAGGGFSLEGWKVSFPAVTEDYYKQALLKALEKAKIIKEDVDLIVPHGVGSNITDRFEAKTILDVFGKNVEKPYITALKPYVGHNLGGSALIETAMLLLSLSNNLVLPTLNCEVPDPRIEIKLVNEYIKSKLNVVIKMACGFAGYNAVSVFKRI